MQLNYNLNMSEAYEGLIATLEATNVKSGAAEGDVEFGFGVVNGTDDEKQVKLPHSEVATIVFDADFVTSNTIDLDVNTVSITQVDFDTDHDTTAANLVIAIAALSGVTCELDSGDVNNRTFIVKAINTDIAIANVVVAAGASQAGSTVTYSNDEIFRGIAIHTHKMANKTNSTANYADKEAVGYLTKGVIWVPTTVAVNNDEAVYVIITGDDRGKFTNSSSGTKATGGLFRKTVAAAGISKVELNLP